MDKGSSGTARVSKLARVTLTRLKAHLPSKLRRRLVHSRLLAPLRHWYLSTRPVAYWDVFYREHVDPWQHADQAKYGRMMELLGGRRYRNALEIACAEGVFSETLASLCDRLLSVDISAVAIERARKRLGHRTEIRFERRTLPDEMPAGPFDLIVAGDVLYFWSRGQLIDFAAALPDLISPGGTFLAAHFRPGDPGGWSMTGDLVHDLLVQHAPLAHTFTASDERHRIDRFERSSVTEQPREAPSNN
jgi:SAM-dependent methyltransferase